MRNSDPDLDIPDLCEALNLLKNDTVYRKYFNKDAQIIAPPTAEDAQITETPTVKDFKRIYDQRQEICHQFYKVGNFTTDNKILDRVEKYMDSQIGTLETNTENISELPIKKFIIC